MSYIDLKKLNKSLIIKTERYMWKTVLKWTICVVLLVYVAVSFAFARYENGLRVCPGIDLRVEGGALPDSVMRQGVNSRLSQFDGKIKGSRLKDIDLQRIEDYLGRFSQFETVDCSFDPDGRVRISVVPIKPEMRVFEPGGKSYYVNRSGKRFEADAEFFVDVPVLILSRDAGVGPEYALPVVRYVSQDAELNSLVAAFKLDGDHDLLLMPRIHGHLVNFGDTMRLAEKKAALLTAYRKILPAKGWNTYDTISVKFRNLVVASRRDKSQGLHGMPLDEGEDLEEATLPEVAHVNLETNQE